VATHVVPWTFEVGSESQAVLQRALREAFSKGSPDLELDVAAGEPASLKVGTQYRDKAADAVKKGDRATAAACLLKAARAFQGTESPKSEVQRKAMLEGPVRAGKLYRDLAKSAAAKKDLLAAAGFHWLAFKALKASSTPLSKPWQKDVLEKGAPRAGKIYSEFATHAAKTSKAAAAPRFLLAAKAFEDAGASLKDWQRKARDSGALRAGTLFRDLARDAVTKGDDEKAAEYFVLAAEAYKQATGSLKPRQKALVEKGASRAANLYQKLAKDAKAKGDVERFKAYKAKRDLLKAAA
jgi:hypothetical protein